MTLSLIYGGAPDGIFFAESIKLIKAIITNIKWHTVKTASISVVHYEFATSFFSIQENEQIIKNICQFEIRLF